MLEFLEDLGVVMLGHALSWDSRIMVVYALSTLAIVFGLWLYRGRPETFLRWTFPKKVYRHKSNLVDILIGDVFKPGVGDMFDVMGEVLPPSDLEPAPATA